MSAATSRPARTACTGLAVLLAACASAPQRPAPAPAAPPVAAIPPGPALDAETAVGGCATAPIGNLGWKYHCGGLVAEVGDHFGEPQEKLREAALAEFRSTWPGTVAEPVQLPLDGKLRPALRVSSGSAAPARRVLAEGAVAVVAFDEVQVRVLACAARPERGGAAACDAVLRSLSDRPWRADPPAGARPRWPPALAGREVLVPPDCEFFSQDGGGYLSCPGNATFLWTAAPADAGRAETLVKQRTARARAYLGASARMERRPCAVDGVESSCACAEGPRPDGLYASCVTAATLRGQALILECAWSGAESTPPVACEAMELR